MPIGHKEETFVLSLVLELNPIFERAKIMADVKTPGGAHAAQDAFFVRGIGHSNLHSFSCQSPIRYANCRNEPPVILRSAATKNLSFFRDWKAERFFASLRMTASSKNRVAIPFQGLGLNSRCAASQ